ncbi:hypothetical protein KUTeg_018913 [Tegillarca granosa]|uniref:Amine oxidase domain-containing protein n=1 Tax=Tegillarca granosa TaxID=220873 RepID=A0ABQ9EG11_TEGGR|nr:hypothetical protein KUTeg_018913 [Tegillarca granosa]
MISSKWLCTVICIFNFHLNFGTTKSTFYTLVHEGVTTQCGKISRNYTLAPKFCRQPLLERKRNELNVCPDTEIKNEVISVLSKIYIKKNIAIPEPIAYVIPRWLSDPLFKGTYTNWTPGYSKDTYKGLCAPIGRFYFAGEACTSGMEGYLHSAFFSGKETVESLLKCMKDKSKCESFLPEYLSRGCTYPTASNYKAGFKADDGSCKLSRCQTSGSSYLFCNYAFFVFTLLIIIV